jgi:hypothetical protein
MPPVSAAGAHRENSDMKEANQKRRQNNFFRVELFTEVERRELNPGFKSQIQNMETDE